MCAGVEVGCVGVEIGCGGWRGVHAPCDCVCFFAVDSGPSGGEGEVSLESVKALGLLVAGMDAAGVVRPLEELASLHSEARAAGYSKVRMYTVVHHNTHSISS